MGMNPNGGQNEFVPLSQLNAAVQRAGTGTAANGDNLFNAAVARPGDHELAVGVELLHFEMSVGVYEHGRWSSVVGRWQCLCGDGSLTVQAERSSASFSRRREE